MLSLQDLTQHACLISVKEWHSLTTAAMKELDDVLNHRLPADNWIEFIEQELSREALDFHTVGYSAIRDTFDNHDNWYGSYFMRCYCLLTPLSRWLAHPRVYEYSKSAWAQAKKPILAAWRGNWGESRSKTAALTAVMMVMCSDGHLRLDSRCAIKPQTRRFFRIAMRLPLDLQQVLANRLWGRADVLALPTDEDWCDTMALIVHE